MLEVGTILDMDIRSAELDGDGNGGFIGMMAFARCLRRNTGVGRCLLSEAVLFSRQLPRDHQFRDPSAYFRMFARVDTHIPHRATVDFVRGGDDVHDMI